MKRSTLYQQLKSISKSNIADLAYIDLQKGQFRRLSDTYSPPTPALLFEFRNIDFSNILKDVQINELTVRAYLYFGLTTDSVDDAAMETESLNLLDKVDEVFQNLEGQRYNIFSQLTRMVEHRPEYYPKHVCYYTDYLCCVKDAKTTTEKTIATPTVKIETETL